jgi:hypothetical protein
VILCRWPTAAADPRPTGRCPLQRAWHTPGKVWYPFLTRRPDAEEFTLPNYGYEKDPPVGIPLDESDEPNRYSIQLYHQIAAQVDLSGKKVL